METPIIANTRPSVLFDLYFDAGRLAPGLTLRFRTNNLAKPTRVESVA